VLTAVKGPRSKSLLWALEFLDPPLSALQHFCDSKHEVTRVQQEEKQQHQRSENNFYVDNNTKTSEASGFAS